MKHTVVKAAADEQRREHTGLRTLSAHYSAREVAAACHVAYGTGAGILREKAHLRAQASTERAREPDSGVDPTAAQDRRGERGVSL